MISLLKTMSSIRQKRLLPWLSLVMLTVACVGVGIPSSGVAGQQGHVWKDAPADMKPLLPSDYHPLPSLKDLVKRLKPAVVNVYTTQIIKPGVFGRGNSMDPRMQRFMGRKDPFSFFFNQMPQREMKRASLGSGFIISPDGYVLTNHHVVDKATEIKVRLADDSTFDAKVVGSDSKTDVALLKIDAKQKLPFTYLGDSDGLEVGDWVIAIGNPFGLGHTVTAGIISAKDRQIGHGPYDDFLQTDAAINPGNSGGPLFDSAGRVIGINTAIVAQGSGIGFAVPINLAKDLLPQLRVSGKVTRGWLGVGIQDLSKELADKFGVKAKSGVLVAQVFSDGPADKAGFKSGDIILALNGQSLTSSRQLTSKIATISPGTRVNINILRDGKRLTLKAKLGEREQGEALAVGNSSGQAESASQQALGLKVAPLTPERARRMGIDEDIRGLVVIDVDPAGPTAGMVQPNDVILEVNRKRIRNLAEFNRAVGPDKKSTSVLMRLQRGGAQIYLVIKK